MEELLKIFDEYRKKIKAYGYAMGVISWDSATEAPRGCFEERSEQIGTLSAMSYELSTSEAFSDIVDAIYNRRDEIDSLRKHEIEVVKKDVDETKKIPQEEFVKFQILIAKSQDIWLKAKQAKDFRIFKDTLGEIIKYMKKIVKYLETDELKGYDVLLDRYEKGFTTKEYDAFFNKLRTELVPFFKKITKIKSIYNFDFNKEVYHKDKQKEFCNYLIDVLGFDRHYGIMKESEHPFTAGNSSTDVRFTVHYYENDFISSIFSAIHELGHALYEQQVNPILNHTFIGGGASMAIHESQSRMYENIIGRSKMFWEAHFVKLKETFPEQLKNVSLDEFYHFINTVKASYIRTEADELSYPLHIMLRYELEKKIFNDEIGIEELEAKWNELFYDYFGLHVEDASQGILQDIHWSDGTFGYFPTYALGSAYASQIFFHLKKDIDVLEPLTCEKMLEIKTWLKEKFHQYGASLYPQDLLKQALGEEFNPDYYINYLIYKYKEVYNLEK